MHLKIHKPTKWMTLMALGFFFVLYFVILLSNLEKEKQKKTTKEKIKRKTSNADAWSAWAFDVAGQRLFMILIILVLNFFLFHLSFFMFFVFIIILFSLIFIHLLCSYHKRNDVKFTSNCHSSFYQVKYSPFTFPLVRLDFLVGPITFNILVHNILSIWNEILMLKH